MLGWYDEDQVALTDPFRTFHDGHLGGPQERKVYVRNDDPLYYYTSVTIAPQQLVSGNWVGIQDTGWGVKLLSGERQPTEAEWDLALSGDTLQLADIGAAGSPDTTYKPVWIRVFCPGNTSAQIKEDLRLRLSALKRLV